MASNTTLSKDDLSQLLITLQERFKSNMDRHKNYSWSTVEQKLLANPAACISLKNMEDTEGEPDVVGDYPPSGDIVFMDCSTESPTGRRSYCYDAEALAARKKNKPADSAVNVATDMGVELLNENEYFFLQKFGNFDNKTSSWIKTPESVRALGGAIFGDYKFGRVFIYHNGADSYYGSRGFRSKLVL